MLFRSLFDRVEALPEKDCLALIQRLTEPPPLGSRPKVKRKPRSSAPPDTP